MVFHSLHLEQNIILYKVDFLYDNDIPDVNIM